MKGIMQALKSARWLELVLIAALMCIAAVVALNGMHASPERTAAETRLRSLLAEIDGAGRVDVVLGEEGAVVTASGAGRIDVMLKLQRAVQAATGFELRRIEVIEAEE